MEPSTASALIGGAASILGGAFGGGASGRKIKRDLRYQYQAAEKYGSRAAGATTAATLKAKVKAAKESGLHPLFAMGHASGSSPSFSIPGQSSRGDAKQDAMAGVAAAANNLATLQARKEIVEAQNIAAALRIAENNTSNDVADDQANLVFAHATDPAKFDPKTQEIKKGEVQPHMPGHNEQGTGITRPMYRFTYGGQDIWLPTQEISEFFDNLGSMGAMAFTYHGNKDVDWDRLRHYHTTGSNKGYKPLIKFRRLVDYHRRQAIKKTARGLRQRRNIKKQSSYGYEVSP